MPRACFSPVHRNDRKEAVRARRPARARCRRSERVAESNTDVDEVVPVVPVVGTAAGGRWVADEIAGDDVSVGHSTITMTMRYAHLAPGGGANLIRALESPAVATAWQQEGG